MIRSFLYVPGNRPDRFTKAMGAGAGAVIFDLEDAVPVSAKPTALQYVCDFLARSGPAAVERWVRVNAAEPGHDDLLSLAGTANLAGVFLPKATREALEALPTVGTGICPIVESAEGVYDAAIMAQDRRVGALAMGEVDLAADLGITPSPDGRELWSLRTQVVVASAAAHLAPPIAGVYARIDDAAGLRESTLGLRRAGFAARQAIHPAQIEVIESALQPTAEERDEARRVLELLDRAGGGACVDERGRMVDEATVRRARRILDES